MALKQMAPLRIHPETVGLEKETALLINKEELQAA